VDNLKIPLAVIAAAGVLLIIGVVILNQGPVPLAPEPPAYQVSICTDTPRYNLMMSSVPGMRLIPVVSGNTSRARLHWTTSYGRFILWDSPDYRVHEYDRDVITDLRPVYWSYDPGEGGLPRPPVSIGLSVEDQESGMLLGRTEIRIGWEEDDTAVMRDPCVVAPSPP
jgi:hypothetical protein